MKICAACCQGLSKEHFSKTQWQLRQHQRRCKECIAANRNVPVMAAPKNQPTGIQDRDNAGASCWMCLEEGPDESGEPLMRYCSCRGGSGFCHLSCVVKYAEEWTKQWDGRNFGKFSEPWEVCPGCHQYYQNKLALALATQFATFVKKHFPHFQVGHLQALKLKLTILNRDHVQSEQQEEAVEIANKIIFIVRQMKAKKELTTYVLNYEAYAYDCLGFIARGDGRAGLKKSVVYFKKVRAIGRTMGSLERVANADYNIALSMAEYEGKTDGLIEKRVTRLQEMYKQSTEQLGKEASESISSGVHFANTLRRANRWIEAERLSTKLAAISKRVHGPDHRLTKDAASCLKRCKLNLRVVGITSRTKGELFQALRYEEDGKRCVVQGPIATPRNVQAEETFTVTSEDIRLTVNTPVVCHGLKSSTHLNGKVGELRSWMKECGCFKVHFEDVSLQPHTVKQDFLQIVFDLSVE